MLKIYIPFILFAEIYDYLKSMDLGVIFFFLHDLSLLPSRHRYSQYVHAQVVDGDGQEVRSTKSSFHHYLCSLKWVPAFCQVEGEQQERKYLCPSSVYLNSPAVSNLLGSHVCYADISPSDFTRAIGKLLLSISTKHLHLQPQMTTCKCSHIFLQYCTNQCVISKIIKPAAENKHKYLQVYLKIPIKWLVICIFWHYPFSGMRHNISVEAMINYLKEWCIKPADKQELRQPDDDLEGADFTSTVQHIHNVYNYLYQNCSKGTLKELFHHSPAVFIEYNRYTFSYILFQIHIKTESPPALILPLQARWQLVFRAFLPLEGGVLAWPNRHVSALQKADSCNKQQHPGAQNPCSLLQSTGRHERLLPQCMQPF